MQGNVTDLLLVGALYLWEQLQRPVYDVCEYCEADPLLAFDSISTSRQWEAAKSSHRCYHLLIDHKQILILYINFTRSPTVQTTCQTNLPSTNTPLLSLVLTEKPR
jgi:hypothetical protein